MMHTDEQRATTENTQGVWTTCDDCGEDWWCVVTERDYLDEPTAWGCSGGCNDGWPEDDYDYPDDLYLRDGLS